MNSKNSYESIEELPFDLSHTLNEYSILAITNRQGKIVYANDNFCKISEYSKEELLGQDHRIISSQYHGKQFFMDLWKTVLSGEIWHGEIRNRSKSGKIYWVDTHIIPKHNDKGDVTHLVAVRIDITDRKLIEQERDKKQSQLIMADKMASLGILTSGVAHEVNNPNHLIMSNSDLLEKSFSDMLKVLDSYVDRGERFEISGLPYEEIKEECKEMFKRISGGAQRIKNIVETLKGFARNHDDRMHSGVQINEVVQSSLTLVKTLLNKSTKNFSLKLYKDIPFFYGNFHQIEQILINFLTNACQALENENQGIEIATTLSDDKKHIQLQVIDQGMGIQDEIIKKVMDPFFTTKRSSGGTGLGLYVSFEIAKQHGGEISFHHNQPKGCIAQLTLPVEV